MKSPCKKIEKAEIIPGNYLSAYDFEGIVDEVINRLRSIQEDGNEKGYSNITVHVDYDYGDIAKFSIKGTRLETEVECEKRLAKSKAARARKKIEREEEKERRRKQFEKLKKEFE